MELAGDRRGQSIQIGAILLFAALIIAFASYQAFVVPNQNREVEFNHNQGVQSDMQDLRNAIVSVGGSDDARSVTVQLGTRYPSRLAARNPGPPSGSLDTVGTTDDRVDLTIENAQASGETGDFWNESQRYNTGGITYSPNYNVYTNPPDTVYEQSVLYNRFPTGNITVSNQSIIDGTDISLVVLNGSVSRSSTEATSVDVRSVSSSTERVRLEDDGSPITITFASTRSAAYWDFLEETQSKSVANVTNASSGGGFYNVSVELRQNRTYSVQLTKVGVGDGVTGEDAAYLTDIEGDGATVTQGETTELTLEVRDRFNNPPDDAAELQVNGSVVGSGSFESTSSGQASKTPGQDGRVTFVYEAPSSATGSQEIQFSYTDSGTGLNTSTPQNVSMSVDVQSSGGGGGGNAYSVTWQNPSGQLDCSGSVCTLDGSNRRSVDLTMRTSPLAQSASVDYAVNNTTVGTTTPETGRTDRNGENTTTLRVQSEGVVDVYTYSGGSGDVIPIEVRNLQLATVAFVDSADSNLKTIQSDGFVRTHVQSSTDQVRAISQIGDIDNDGTDDIAYVTNSQELKYVDTSSNSRQTVLSGGAAYSGYTIGIGDGVGGPELELYYRNSSDNGYLYRAFPNGTTERLIYGNQGCNPQGGGNANPISSSSGVLDVTDFDADGNADIVYVNGDQKIAYINTTDCSKNTVPGDTDYSVATNNAPGGGEVMGYNGELVVPIVDSNQDFTMISANGTTATLASSYQGASKTPIAPRNWDGDSELELVHINGDENSRLYYAGVQDAELVEITNDNDASEKASDGSGAR